MKEEFDYFEDKLYDERVNQQEERMKEQKKDVEEFKLTKELFDLYWHLPEKLPMFYYYRDHYWYLHPKAFIQIVDDYLVDCEDVIGDLHSLINGEAADFFQTLVENTIH